MESTVSATKGVFLFTNGCKQKNSKKKPKPLFEKLFSKDPWYVTYKNNWNMIEDELKDLHQRTYSMLLNDIVNYIHSFHLNNESVPMEGIIPSATILTGVNQPDHVSQFSALIENIRTEVTPQVAFVNSQDAPTIKHMVENAVWQLMYGHEALEVLNDTFDDDTSQKKLKKNQCTMKALNKWYQAKTTNLSPKKKNNFVSIKPLVIIMPDFESFNCNVLQDFVMIVSSYVSTLPIVFVFGVATSVSALHKSFPYHVSSKLLIKVFHSHSSAVYMNRVLEDIFLTHTSPIHLSGKAFELLTGVFLFYDFSVVGIIQSIKYCMMDHFYGDNVKSLCCDRDKLKEAISNLSKEDLENVRQLASFRTFGEAQDLHTRMKLLLDDKILRKTLFKEMNKLHDYLYSFYTCIRLLSVFLKDLPKNVLGKSVPEIYSKCTVSCVTDTPAFEECMQLLKFQSKVQLVESIKNAVKMINSALKIATPVKPLRSTPPKNYLGNISLDIFGETFIKAVGIHLNIFLRYIENSNTEATLETKIGTEDDNYAENMSRNRLKLAEKLFEASRTKRIQTEFEMIRSRFVSYLKEVFSRGLQPPRSHPFHEVLVFSDVASVKKQIVGSPRGAIHTALCNPVHYLQCSCCHLPSPDSMVDTLPDVCLAYKLHRECGRHINLYDWLQAFAAVLRPEEDDELRHQDPGVRIRFTQAVAELQFLGFIKASKRKTDHVMRLTW